MADSYIPGEKKIRPGAHYHIGKKGTGATAGAVNGVTAVLFRADFGPLCTAVEMSSDEDYTDDGWKKIRRTKTRYELIRRCNTTNDDNRLWTESIRCRYVLRRAGCRIV